MIKNSHCIFLIICFSFLFSLSDSRLITSWDMPSEYTLDTDYLNNSFSIIDSKVKYDITSGLAFSYEHRIIDKEKFNFFLGSEIMLGKKSDVSLAFHSIYVMPTYKINDSSDILFRLGYSSLNTNDNALPDSAHMIGLGYEVNISDMWSINFSNTFYKTNTKENSILVCPSLLEDCNEESFFNEIEYNKFSISLVYKVVKKEENSSSRRRGRNS